LQVGLALHAGPAQPRPHHPCAARPQQSRGVWQGPRASHPAKSHPCCHGAAAGGWGVAHGPRAHGLRHRRSRRPNLRCVCLGEAPGPMARHVSWVCAGTPGQRPLAAGALLSLRSVHVCRRRLSQSTQDDVRLARVCSWGCACVRFHCFVSTSYTF
jgi:hypothetical protein